MTYTKHIPTFHDVMDKVSVLFWKIDKENESLIFDFPDASKMKNDFWERAFETAQEKFAIYQAKCLTKCKQLQDAGSAQSLPGRHHVLPDRHPGLPDCHPGLAYLH